MTERDPKQIDIAEDLEDAADGLPDLEFDDDGKLKTNDGSDD